MTTTRLSHHLTTQRLGKTQPDEPGRSPFEIDTDRILFCEGFRALADKTQVHSMMLNDYTRSRLTHSLEVSRVGRTLGHRLGQKMELGHFTASDISHIVAAACLMHDIGNPPFGHVGEDIISDFFKTNPLGLEAIAPCTKAEQLEFQHLEGNAQGFRLVTRLQGWRAQGGLSLTSATLAAAAKYPWAIDTRPDDMEKMKYNFLHDDAAAFTEVAKATHMHQEADLRWRRHPLAYLVEAADDICYLVVDIEDATHLGVLTLAEAEELLLPMMPLLDHADYHSVTDPSRKLVYLRAKAIGGLVDAMFEAWSDVAQDVLSGEHPGDLLDKTALGPHLEHVRRFSREKIYRNRQTPGIQHIARQVLNSLLTLYLQNLLAKEAGKPHQTEVLEGLEALPSDRRGWLRGLIDHLSSMTDHRVLHEATRLGIKV